MGHTSDIKKGLCININGYIYKILEFLHVKPGKGGAFIRTKIKNITNGSILEYTFSSGHKIDIINMNSYIHQYLYKDIHGFYFMNINDYNQICLDKSLIKFPNFMKEGINISITYRLDNNTPVFIEMPINIYLKVKYTEPGIKGDTINNCTKLAILETGAKIRVPLFINNNDIIKVNIENNLYLERKK